MPYVNVQVTRGASRDQKAQLVKDVTDSLVRVPGKKPEHIHVVIQDFEVGAPAQIFGQASLGFVNRLHRPDDPAELEPEAHELNLGVGAAVALGTSRWVLELTGSTNRWNNGGEERELFITPGVVLDLPGTWELGIGTSLGLSDGNDEETQVRAFLLWEF